ncbi:MAG: LarC family nickel insertion protein, partial [Verrucomicrobia bacterium]|nr:LarC family nickel insertion protein [Verrucomicrobiota bacterium]
DGHGTFECAHGTLPIPAPATLQILEGIKISQIAVEQELITPTGAALVAEFQSSVGIMPSLAPKRIGYGLGSRHLPNRPNALRGVLADQPISTGTDRILEISVNVDDLSPEILGNTMDKLLRAGAAESYFTPVHMKKNRLGVLITVLVDRSNLDAIQRILFQETTTFGLRYREVERLMLERDIVKVSTPAGEIELKIGRLGDELLQASPEFESCKKAAESSGMPLRQVYQLATDAFFRPQKSKTS